ncbi:MAG: HD domain-containing protein [Pirellulaceae bacterium]|nr:HD domain-containing protein [Pirellulaceae bacterium]
MRDYHLENLSHDPVHGYIPFTSPSSVQADESSEQDIIDHPWVQRLRQIHQLQTAWWVYPSAEHTRFQHVLGVMHLASRVVAWLYDSLRETCPDVPSRGYVETLLRMAGLLHDVGHGPFGHFFDEHFLKDFGLTHETLGARIIQDELGGLLRRLTRNPNSQLAAGERLDPGEIAWLIARPQPGDAENRPRWLRFVRGLLSGIYTIDNMDFVLRDAYMSGYSQRAYDLDRLLHYSFFSERGLTIHDRGIEALVRFMGVRAELFRAIYFHRTVRAIDLTLADLFADSKPLLFPGNPLEHLERYQQFTEFSLLVDVARWKRSGDPQRVGLGERWEALLRRQLPWKMICQRSLIFSEADREQQSIFSEPRLVEHRLRDLLPADLRSLPLRLDIARHLHRPHTRGASGGQNFLYDSAHQRIRPLTANELIDRLPVSHRICRIYALSHEHAAVLATALDQLIGGVGADDVTNM